MATTQHPPIPGGFVAAELQKLLERKVDPQTLYQHTAKLSIDLVLTAHPTEVMRRSVSSKFLRIARLLAEKRDRHDLSGLERTQIRRALHRAIAEVWATDEIRRRRPTPVDEAKTSLVTVEHSLWDVVPKVAPRTGYRADASHRQTPATGFGADSFWFVDRWRPRWQSEYHARGYAAGVSAKQNQSGTTVLN